MQRPIRSILISLAVLALAGMLTAGLFTLAGRWDLPMFWAAMIVLTVVSVVGSVAIDPDLLQERLRPGPGGKDMLTVVLAQLLSTAGLVFAALDVGRYHWSDTVPRSIQIPGLVLCASGLGLAIWAMIVNRYFSSVVRLQVDRGHRLVTAGPYRWVRHPGYTGMLLGLPGFGAALGSWLSTLAFGLLGALILRRTILEDRFLHEKLPGYGRYAERVRWRLVPGVW